MRTFCFFIMATMLMAMGPLFATGIELFNQPYDLNGSAYTSAWDPSVPVDYEVADNFGAVNMPFNKFVFYGVTALWDDVNVQWLPSPPLAVEPFKIKFYEYEEGWTEPIPGIYAPTTGIYTIRMYDAFGDGWNGGMLDVYVNGVLTLNDITLAAGTGPEDVTFAANTGDYITTVYTAGMWAYENWYQILDPELNVIATDGIPYTSPPTGLGTGPTYILYEPTWSSPSYSFNLPVTVTFIGPWSGAWNLYKFEAYLPQNIPMTEGWASAQIDIPSGSGVWFLWLNSSTGDDNSHQRMGAKSNPAFAYIASPNAPKEQLYNDLAFELWYEEPNVPVELSSFSAVLTAENLVKLNWVTQSETGVQGYYLYRSNTDVLDGATLVSPLIEAANSSEQHSYSYTDSELYEAGMYYYWLQNIDLNGNTDFHGPVSVNFSATGQEITPEIPAVTELKSIYPNPFNPTAIIPFSVAEKTNVGIRIFNTRGQLLRHFDLAERAPGNYQIAWDGKDSSGKECSSGIYYIVLNAGKDTFQRKAVLQK